MSLEIRRHKNGHMERDQLEDFICYGLRMYGRSQPFPSKDYIFIKSLFKHYAQKSFLTIKQENALIALVNKLRK